MSRDAVLAIDLGAESGRAVLVGIDPAATPPLAWREVHRFPNAPRALDGVLRWDLARLIAESVEGLRRGVAAATAAGWRLRSVGVDAWGVDFGLLDAAGELLAPPLCYRDPRAQEACAEVLAAFGRARLYEATGIQFLPFNTIHQLVGMQRREPELLARAVRLLFVPDLIHQALCGVAANEATIASTSQLVDPRRGEWARGVLGELGLPERLFGPIVAAGTPLGTVRAALGAGAGVQVVAPAAHDTASAVLAVPAGGERRWAFLSSGTWSLLGVERAGPLLGAAACAASFTNERGFGGSIRFLKNVSGLWLVQECRRAFAREGREFGYDELERLAGEAGPSPTRLDVADPSFALPGGMPDKIRAFARRTGQWVPEEPGALVRCGLDSLAAAHADAFGTLEALTGERIDVLHMVGGGIRNGLHVRLTAAAIGRPVVAGPVEATALGNALSQAIGLGLVGGVGEARRMVRGSVELRAIAPG